MKIGTSIARRMLRTTLWLLLLPAAAAAGYYGVQALRTPPAASTEEPRASVTEEIARLLPLAEAGDIVAAARLGIMLDDPAEAIRWTMVAAAAGDTGSMARLAIAYDRGNGVARDRAAAADLYRRLAEAGHYQKDWADRLMDGDGVAKDEALAVVWYKAALAAGNEDVLMPLANLYVEGRIAERDLVEAHALTEVALRTFDASYVPIRAEVRILRETIVPLMSAADLTAAETRADAIFDAYFRTR